MSNDKNTYQPPEEAVIDVKALLNTLLQNWGYYVIIGIWIAVFALAYLKLVSPTYLVSTTLLIHNDNSTPSDAEILFQSLNLNQNTKALGNEIGLIKSFNIIRETIKSLDFEISYFEESIF